MANLKNFLNSNIQTGSKSDLYIWPATTIKVGEGTWHMVEELHLKATGNIRIGEIRAGGDLEVIMGSHQANGNDCTVILNGARFENVNYRSSGNNLRLEKEGMPGNPISLEPGRSQWSWFYPTLGVAISVGAWPAGKAMTGADLHPESLKA